MRSGAARAARNQSSASASDRIAFQPAIEIPSQDQATSSQSTTGVARIWSSSSPGRRRRRAPARCRWPAPPTSRARCRRGRGRCRRRPASRARRAPPSPRLGQARISEPEDDRDGVRPALPDAERAGGEAAEVLEAEAPRASSSDRPGERPERAALQLGHGRPAGARAGCNRRLKVAAKRSISFRPLREPRAQPPRDRASVKRDRRGPAEKEPPAHAAAAPPCASGARPGPLAAAHPGGARRRGDRRGGARRLALGAARPAPVGAARGAGRPRRGDRPPHRGRLRRRAGRSGTARCARPAASTARPRSSSSAAPPATACAPVAGLGAVLLSRTPASPPST